MALQSDSKHLKLDAINLFTQIHLALGASILYICEA